jgi:hypothetical protein
MLLNFKKKVKSEVVINQLKNSFNIIRNNKQQRNEHT